MSGASLTRRYWWALTGAPQGEQAPPPERGRAGYGLWQRYWAALLNIRLPSRDVQTDNPARGNPLNEPYVDGPRIRLPRFDRAAVRLAATGEAERAAATYTVGDRRFVLRESGPGQLELLVETQRPVSPTDVLPIEVADPTGDRRLFMVFVRDERGGSVGVLRVAEQPGWLDITVDDQLPATALDAVDPEVRAQVADSVRATPDPGMEAWNAIQASRPPGDPLHQVITDADR
jgi:hypothetical protein